MGGSGSSLRTLCSVLALAAAAAVTDAASAQPIEPVPRDIRTGVFRGQLVSYEVIDGLAVWDGDIILGTPEELSRDGGTILAGPPDHQTKISSESDEHELWPGGVIPYSIDPELTNPHVAEGIRHWEENTPIRFIKRTHQNRWLRFRPSRICAAVLGQFSYELRWTDVILHQNCGLGTVIHEIGHAVGLWHEQQRNDRGQHVWVAPGSDPPSGAYGSDSGPYDYGSVMHYSCIENLVTIPPGIPCGSEELSAADIDGVSRLYGKIPAETRITTNPAGLLIEVDGETYTAPQSFDWKPGSQHTIGVPAPQQFVGDRYYAGDGYRFLFAKWSDGGAQTHTVTASSETTVFIANFILQTRTEYRAVPPYGGTIRVEPPSSDGFQTRFAFIKLLAEPAEGFSFLSWGRWSSGLGPASNPKVTNRVRSYDEAVFTRQLLTRIETNAPGVLISVDGDRRFLPQNFAWEAGSTHTLGLRAGEETGQEGVILPYLNRDGERLVFEGWSDGGAVTHDFTVSEERPTITVNFRRQVLLNTGGSGPPITVDPPGSDGGYHDLSSTVWLTAQEQGREFVSWLGDLSGSENPKALLMDSPKQVFALFMNWEDFRSGKIVSGKPVSLRFGDSFDSRSDYWIVVPQGATKLEVRLETDHRRGAIDLHANYGFAPYIPYSSRRFGQYLSAHSSRGTSRYKSIIITPASSPPLRPGPYFIKVHQRKPTGHAQGKLRVNLTVAEVEIAAKVLDFGIPASLITTREGEAAPMQILEVRNTGEGMLNYQISTDQPWLSVSTDQGSAMEETDVIEIRADATAMEPGAFEGTITITERPPVEGFTGLFSQHEPAAWPVKVPVTLIVIPDSWEEPSDSIPTMPEEDEDDSEGEEEESEDNEDESGGLAVEVRLNSPEGVAVDAAGNLYIADSGSNRIRRVDPSGTITAVAGTGVEGYTGDGGPATDARLCCPTGVTVDGAGNLFIVDGYNQRIRKVDTTGAITTVAGIGVEGFSGDGGPAIEAQLANPTGVAVDAAGNLFIADSRNQRIRRVDAAGIISTFAGGGDASGPGGPAVQARLGYPSGVAVDAAGNLYIAVITNSTIRRVAPSGTIATIAGVGRWGFTGDGGPAAQAHLHAPSDVAVDTDGNLFIADENNHRIRRVDPSGAISTIAGTGEQGFAGDGGPAVQAKLYFPRGVAVDASGNVYIADHGNHRIRRVDASGTITTIAGTGETGF